MGCDIMIGVGGRCRCTVDGFKFQVEGFRLRVSGCVNLNNGKVRKER